MSMKGKGGGGIEGETEEIEIQCNEKEKRGLGQAGVRVHSSSRSSLEALQATGSWSVLLLSQGFSPF